jgi:hypothetical protein
MKKLIGGILMGLGILIGGTSGLCTLIFLVTLGPAALLFGGIPIAVGAFMFWGGRALWRSVLVDEAYFPDGGE